MPLNLAPTYGQFNSFTPLNDARQLYIPPPIPLLVEHVSGEVFFMQPLHYDDLYPSGRIVEPAAEGLIKTIVDALPLRFRERLVGVQRIVEDQNVAAHAGGRGLHRRGKHRAARGV